MQFHLELPLSSLTCLLIFYLGTGNSQEDELADMAQDPGANTKVDDCATFSTQAGDFEKISPSSKYLIFRGNTGYDEGWEGDDAPAVCESIDQLEPAEVTNKFDLQSLEKKIFSSAWIGLSHKGIPGVFIHSNGDPIVFQSFVGMEPNNVEMAERCVLLKPEDGYLTMEDAGCTSVKAEALCQYRKGSTCFLQSSEEAASSSAKGIADIVILAVGGRFFVSTSQKPWSTAYETCLTNGLQLVTLDDDDINQDLADQIKKRMTEQHLHPATQFWTAGTFKENGTALSLHWFVGEDSSMPAIDLVPHHWAKATPDAIEPFDQSGAGVETCLDVSFEKNEEQTAGAYAPYWRASNCLLPKYFICEKIPTGVPENVIEAIVDEELAKDGNATDGLEGRAGWAREVQSCGDIAIDPLNFEIDITKPQTEEDIIKFLIYNIEHDLKTGEAPYEIKEELKWKEKVIDLLVKITQKSVDTVYVDHGLLNVIKVINLMYFNSIAANSTTGSNSSKHQQVWEEKYIKHLEKCLNVSQKLELSGPGYEIRHLKKDDEIEDIKVPEEYADTIENLDTAVDVLWYMFSFTVGLCYNLPYNGIRFASDFHVYFIADFMHDLREKWTINVETADSSDSRGLDYSLALGDFDFIQSFKNLRFLVTAAYLKNDIKDLQLVRPLDMSTINSDTQIPKQNKKTGNNLKLR